MKGSSPMCSWPSTPIAAPRQAQIQARLGVALDRSTLAHWGGVFGRTVPRPCTLAIGKDKDDNRPARRPASFQYIDGAAAHEVAAAILRNRGRSAAAIGLESRAVASGYAGDEIGGHGEIRDRIG